MLSASASADPQYFWTTMGTCYSRDSGTCGVSPTLTGRPRTGTDARMPGTRHPPRAPDAGPAPSASPRPRATWVRFPGPWPQKTAGKSHGVTTHLGDVPTRAGPRGLLRVGGLHKVGGWGRRVTAPGVASR